ncbi:hypothetical protein B4135_2241 [Caldibacillus debilis]|uniref:Uncharacterized protein n=1 Tax=Caldibacillus debilis TaxID=301148 RepID=A0A150M296_9BACI|nr:hypothetical protein B4135_2241 [Caldibacillus debilis]
MGKAFFTAGRGGILGTKKTGKGKGNGRDAWRGLMALREEGKNSG